MYIYIYNIHTCIYMTVAAALCQCVSAHIASVGVSLGSIPHIECVSRVNVSRGQCVHTNMFLSCYCHTHPTCLFCQCVNTRVCMRVCMRVCVSVYGQCVSLLSMSRIQCVSRVTVSKVWVCTYQRVSRMLLSHMQRVPGVNFTYWIYPFVNVSMCVCQCVSVCVIVCQMRRPMCVSDDNVKHATCFSC